MNNKVAYEKFDVLLYASYGRSLDVQISLPSTRLQWTKKGRSIDVQYGTWTDRPNKDILRTSLGRAMPPHFNDLSLSKAQFMKYVTIKLSHFLSKHSKVKSSAQLKVWGYINKLAIVTLSIIQNTPKLKIIARSFSKTIQNIKVWLS